MSRSRSLADVYRRFGEETAAGASPLYERVAAAVAASAEALRAIEAAPPRRRRPELVLAALHDLALAGRAPALAAAYAAGDGETAAAAAVDALLRLADPIAAIVTARCSTREPAAVGAVLHPAVAEAARRAGAEAIGLVDVGCAAGFDLVVDRVGVTYGNGQARGDRSSPVQLSATVVGDGPVPSTPLPAVVARIGIDADPVDVSDPDDARWLRACTWPDQPERRAAVDAAIALVAAERPTLLPGDAVDLLPDAIDRVPTRAIPVVVTTWTLSDLSTERRLRFLRRLDAAATDRPLAWVSVEGVGVAPAIPTLGDRPASGHSIVGIAVLRHGSLQAEAVGRCWSRGRWFAWLGDPAIRPPGAPRRPAPPRRGSR